MERHGSSIILTTSVACINCTLGLLLWCTVVQQAHSRYVRYEIQYGEALIPLGIITPALLTSQWLWTWRPRQTSPMTSTLCRLRCQKTIFTWIAGGSVNLKQVDPFALHNWHIINKHSWYSGCQNSVSLPVAGAKLNEKAFPPHILCMTLDLLDQLANSPGFSNASSSKAGVLQENLKYM